MVVEDDIHGGRRPGVGWTPVTYGAQVRADRAGSHPTRLRAWQLVLPFWSSFTGLTAARLRGWWLPPVPECLPLFVASGSSARMSRSGLAVCRHDEIPRWSSSTASV